MIVGMKSEAFRAFLSNQREAYRKISKVYCRVLNSFISFNSEGFRHLTHNGLGKSRNHGDTARRFHLFPRAVSIIREASEISKHTFIGTIEYWRLEKGKTAVILRKVGNGHIHFYSIMDKR